jgi:transcriptional regulator with XRE-family HTH domain
MKGPQLSKARESAGLTQQQAASALGVSQAYLSMLERGRRTPARRLAERLANLYGLLPELPPVSKGHAVARTEDAVAKQLGSLGYPGFSHLRARRRVNPTELLYWALSREALDARLAEALPWVVLHRQAFIDWGWLVAMSKLGDRQNRLGLVVSVARRLADDLGARDTSEKLRRLEAVLERSRLVQEDTFFEQVRSERLSNWLRERQSAEARHWNVLTDFGAEKMRYASASPS